MYVVGVDLSGPANPENTAVAVFQDQGERLEYQALLPSATDAVLFEEIQRRLAVADVCVGLDAPLSYGSKGGQRESDAALRAKAIQAGLLPGSIMAPTAPRMAYLTLRGLAVARGMQLLPGPGRLRVVETHPGAALALGGAPVDAVRGFRDSQADRDRLVRWLGDQGLRGVECEFVTTDHSLAACAAAWATWRWNRGQANWVFRADPPHHPFDFAC